MFVSKKSLEALALRGTFTSVLSSPDSTLGPVICLVAAVAACGGAPEAEVRYGARFDSTVPRYVIPDAPTCPECSIELVDVAELGQAGDPTSVAERVVSHPCVAAPLSGGEWVVSGTVGGGELVVYDSTGGVARTIGRAGAGPGEFGSRNLRVMALDGDSLVVLDYTNLRAVKLDPAGRVAASVSLAAPYQAHAVLAGGDLVIHGRPRTADGIQLFRILSFDGERASFGSPDPGLSESGIDQWTVDVARPDGFWASSIWEYELYRWSGSGQLMHTLVRDADWFPPDPDLSRPAFQAIHVETPAPPILLHVYEDDSGRLWTYTFVPDSDWGPAPPEQPSPEWVGRTFDVVIEVIDLEARRVVARDRIDFGVRKVCGLPLVHTVVETETGNTQLKILRPRLVEGGTE